MLTDVAEAPQAAAIVKKNPSASAAPTGGRIRWDYGLFFLLLHVLALVTLHPWFFSWAGIVAFLAGVVIFGQLGIPIAYHRLLAHRSFRCPKWFERTLVTLAMCSAQESPAHWVAWHRMHHSHADDDGDPHSPRRGWFWAHVSWLIHENRSRMEIFSMYHKYARDILADPYYMWIQRLPSPSPLFYFVHVVLYGAITAGICLALYGNTVAAWQLAASVFMWGVVVRTVWVWHITWSVNSISHLFGYRNYETSDDSRNNWFVTLLTGGEGWHNNHHADPASATVQHRWWEIDANYYVIRLFGWLGLATHIIPPRSKRQAATSGGTGPRPSVARDALP